MKNTMRNKLRRAALLVLALLMATSTLSACGQTPDQPTAPSAKNENYTVKLTASSGRPLSRVDVLVYADATLADLVAVAKTDAKGIATFDIPAAKGYAAVLKGVPAGYPLEESYVITKKTTEIVLTAELIQNPDLSKNKFRRDSVMFDFTVTDTQGNTYTLSELLQNKKAVVLNFWFAKCNPCKAEFPFMQRAFEKYSDDIALLALNPVDDAQTVAQYRAAEGFDIPMASVDAVWMQAFELMSYPTTMVIDRFGNINLVHVGSVPNALLFENLFAYYAADDYVQQSGLSMGSIPEK